MGKKDNTRAPPQKKRGARSIDWDHWRNIYVYAKSPLTFQDLSKMEGAPSASHIGKKAYEQNWSAEREKFRKEIEKRIADRAADEIAAARMLHTKVARAAILKGSQILAQTPSEKGTLRDAARLMQFGFSAERQTLGMDKPEQNEDAIADGMRQLFFEFLSSKEVGFTDEEAQHTIDRFVAFLDAKRSRP